MQIDPLLNDAMKAVPSGRWGVAVSGGADSVALLRLACLQPHLQPHVIHLDHETRDGQSAGDASFVTSLAEQLNLPAHHARRSQVEEGRTDCANSSDQDRGRQPGRNVPARYRAARIKCFGIAARQFQLRGVLLAHHADDQTETIIQRLLRGRQPAGLRGMSIESTVDGVRLLRPLLRVPRESLRTFLGQIDQPWVEDVSNSSAVYQRNRVRESLAGDFELRDAALALGACSGRLADWLEHTAPNLADSFELPALSSLPKPLARHTAARWLRERGSPAADISLAVCDRLIDLAADPTTPPRIDFPGAITIRRSRGRIFALPSGIKGSQQKQPMGVIHNVGSAMRPTDRSTD